MHPPFEAIANEIDDCMLADQRLFRRRLSAIRKRHEAGRPVDKVMGFLAAEIAESGARRRRRAQQIPKPQYPEKLPVAARREEIKKAIAENQVVVVAGETGSGKTTQLPKICLELGRGVAGLIGHTQPRRIAARSVASRIASELKVEVGHAVGYQVRFQERVNPNTYVKLMTDGILLAETQGDRELLQYDTLIIDEAHERSLNIDFLLGYMKQLLPQRPDLKLIITSATIDTARFARHFDDAPVIEVSGRTYPVEVRYRPLQSQDPDAEDRDMQQAIVEAAAELSRIDRGDILVFLSGEREIRETAEALRKHHPPGAEILPLFARLSIAEQNRVFEPHGNQRIVLATNVAETSLTVPGIRYVIDTGYARVSRYSHRSKVQRLPIEKISRASADQRKGRCGRVSAGVCIRLYDEEDYSNRPEFTEPEVQRTNLAAVILRMKALGLGEADQFPLIDPPDRRYIADGYRLLHELGAVDSKRELTKLGSQLARLPIDPRVARMILEADKELCLREALIIASALTVQDPRERPLDAQEKADEAQRRFQDDRSDFLAFLNLWDFYHEQARHLSSSKLRKLCHEHFLAFRRMREWHDIHQQLGNQVKDLGLRINQLPAEYDAIHRALLAGLLGNIGFKSEDRAYAGSHGKKFSIFPGSALFKKGPKWLVAAELVETTRLYGRTVAAIKPEWVERLAQHLIKHNYSEAHWEKRPAQVAAYDQVTLYGLTLITRRKVNYGPVNPDDARVIFIRSALVEGDYDTRAGFFRHNRALVDEIHGLEDKSRRRDILVEEDIVYRFYDVRIPSGIYSGKTFEKWRQQAERDDPRVLFMHKEQLMRHGAQQVTQGQFPEHLTVDGMELDLEYHFEPGHPADGVTLRVPIAALNGLRPDRFEWLVPGLLQEKIVRLIKSLPKSLRRNFVPAPDFASACIKALSPGQGPLLGALGAQLRCMTGVEVPADAWQVNQLPDYLNMNFRVVDENGRLLAMGRSLGVLQQQLGERARESFARLPVAGLERNNVVAWDFGDLPDVVEVVRDGVRFRGYPALVEEGEALALRVLDTRDKARLAMRAGVRRLFMLQQRQEVAYLRKNLPGIQAMCLHYLVLGSCEQLKDDLVTAVTDQTLFGAQERTDTVRNAGAFEQLRAHGRSRLMGVANELCGLMEEILSRYHELAKQLKSAIPAAWLPAVSDIRDQLEHLVYPGFAAEVPLDVLQQYPRYLKAIQRRLKRLEQNPARDRQNERELAPLWHAYLERKARHDKEGINDPELDRYRWMIEELRVSVFAQELRTAQPVSIKRLREQWDQVAP